MPKFRSRAALAAAAFALFVAAFAPARPAAAWWASGHAAIAMMAYRQMKPETRASVDAILKAHPDYANWLKELPAGTPEDKRGEFIVAIASTWPDRIKDASDDSVVVKMTRSRSGDAPAVTLGQPVYPDLNAHSNWHYYDIPIDADGQIRPESPGESIETALPKSIAELSRKGQPATFRAYWLCWYLHLVGDAHQPLHAAGRFSAAHPNGDQGGNAVLLQTDPAHPSVKNLHGFWDSLLGEGADPKKYNTLAGDWIELNATIDAVTAEAPRLEAGYDPSVRDDLNPKDWLQESFTIAQQTVYTFGDVDASGAVPPPDPAFRAMAVRIAHQRAALAAHRLALGIEGALSGK